jgi:hypothetical protein
MASLSVVSEIAIVPESECRIPTLMVSSAAAPPIMVDAIRPPSISCLNVLVIDFPLLSDVTSPHAGARRLEGVPLSEKDRAVVCCGAVYVN